MKLTVFQALMAALAAIVAMLATISVALRWIYKQGVASQKLVSAIDKNTVATGKLSTAYDKFTEKTDGTLFDHEKRITRLEAGKAP